MNKKLKIALITTGIIIILVVATGVTFMQVIERKYKPTALDLTNAPQEIKDIKEDLSAKLEIDTFTWADMPDFVIFSQYVADNHQIILDLVEDWEEIVWFNVADEDDMWFIITGGSLTYDIGPDPPEGHGILIELDFATTIEIIRTDVTPQQAFMKGDLTFDGKFSDVLKVNQIVEIAATTLSGAYVEPVEIKDNFLITVDNPSLYDKGLTLLPYNKISLIPDQYGTPNIATPVEGKSLIVDSEGKIVYELEDSFHSFHMFVNSSTIAQGGQENVIELWNYKTGNVEFLDIPEGHHSFDYNPITDTFMVIEYFLSEETWEGQRILYDLLSEYSRDGDLIWQWNSSTHYPFNSSLYTTLCMNRTFHGGADWTHANSFVWDKQEDIIYLHLCNVDTILKIDYNTKDILLEVGYLGNFTSYNIENQEVDTLFNQAHSLDRISENRFIIFDNDLYNTSNPETMTLENSLGYSRILEFEIDEVNETIKEIWSWTPSNQSYYFPESGGDADRLPNGNTLSIFANKAMVLNLQDPALITEVTRDGEIAWEMQIDGLNNTFFWVPTLKRFYDSPLVEINSKTLDSVNNELKLDITTWDTIKFETKTEGIVKILVDKKLAYEDEFEFLSKWQPTNLNITLENVSVSAKQIHLIIENQDGSQTIVEIYNLGMLTKNLVLTIIMPIFGCGVVAFGVIYGIRKDIFKKLFRNKD